MNIQIFDPQTKEKVFDSDTDKGTGQQFLEDHPNQSFRVKIAKEGMRWSGDVDWSGDE